MFCTKCGNLIKDGFKFCPKCGAPVYVKKDTPESEVKKGEIEVQSQHLKQRRKLLIQRPMKFVFQIQ